MKRPLRIDKAACPFLVPTESLKQPRPAGSTEPAVLPGVRGAHLAVILRPRRIPWTRTTPTPSRAFAMRVPYHRWIRGPACRSAVSLIVLAGFGLGTLNLPLPSAGVGPCGRALCCCPVSEREAGRCCCASSACCEVRQAVADSGKSCPRCHHNRVAAVETVNTGQTPRSLLVPGRCHGHPDANVTEGIVIISVNTPPWSPACHGSGTISLASFKGDQRPEAPPSPPPRAA
jgi:hypothetical protein